MVFLGFSALATLVFPFPNSKGFPFTYSGSVDACRNPYTGGCGLSYNPVLVGLDYVFWVAEAFVFVGALEQAWVGSPLAENQVSTI